MMKYLLKAGFLVIIILLITLSSCRHVVYVKSETKILSRTFEPALKDSAMIYGRVYYAGDEKKTGIPRATIWMEESTIKTMSNDTGYFSITVPPAKYTIKCLGEFSSPEFTMTVKDLRLAPNEKVEINFLHGSKSE